MHFPFLQQGAWCLNGSVSMSGEVSLKEINWLTAVMPQPSWHWLAIVTTALVMAMTATNIYWTPCAKYCTLSALYLWSHLYFWLACEVNTIVTPFTHVETDLKQVIKDISGSVMSLVSHLCLSPPRCMLQVLVKKPFPPTSHTILWLFWHDQEKRQADFSGGKFRVVEIHPNL